VFPFRNAEAFQWVGTSGKRLGGLSFPEGFSLLPFMVGMLHVFIFAIDYYPHFN